MYMSDQAFENLVDWLLDNGCDWKNIEISNTHINKIIVPAAGLYIVDRVTRHFEIIYEKRYVAFSLKYL